MKDWPSTTPIMNIDSLKRYGVDPVYFGLGFIQLKISLDERIHFYHDLLPVLVDEPHDHRYGFSSYIMQGNVQQTLYTLGADGNNSYLVTYDNCGAPTPQTAPESYYTYISQIFKAEYSKGDSYRIEDSTLHTIKGSNNAITYLQRDKPMKAFARVVRPMGVETVCPFSGPIPVARCWEMIDEMLSQDKRIDEPVKSEPKKYGYHLADIDKGTLGEVSKIIEEALELKDAHAQGVRIMAQVEMSDLYGAFEHYREKYYPEVSMKDIRDMYLVTRRAFENGTRK